MLQNLSKGLISIKYKIKKFSNINEIIVSSFKKINHLLNQYSKVIDINVTSVKTKNKYGIKINKNRTKWNKNIFSNVLWIIAKFLNPYV